MDIERVALGGLEAGIPAVSEEDLADGRPRAIAADVTGGAAAVLVVQHVRDDVWQVDTVMFRREDARWVPILEAGGVWPGTLLQRFDSPDEQALDLVGGSMSGGDHVDHHAAGGFVPRQVVEIEIAAGDRSRRVPVDPSTGACVVCLVTDGADTADPDAVDVRAYDVHGALLESTRRRRRRLADELPGMTVSEALARPDGRAVTVRGFLLVLAGQGPQLCDRIDVFEEPPRPAGASLRVSAPWTADLPVTWSPGQNGMEISLTVLDGIVSGGVLVVAGT